MSGMKRILFVVISSLLAVSCSVISKEVRKEAQQGVPFRDLVENTSHYIGKTVLLGGYILAARREEGGVLIEVSQAPLSTWEIPGDRARTEGRFVVIDTHSEDLAKFREGLAITVAGRVLGRMTAGTENCPNPCLKVESRELHVRWGPGVRGRGFVDLGNDFTSPWYFEEDSRYPYGRSRYGDME
jgi:starvation-inducible outer membrane lipoprotein